MAAGIVSGVYWDLLCGWGSIINGDGMYMHSWTKKIIFKWIIESVINRSGVVIQC